ncbi:unnamed protein product [Closterium sp. Naga37s-1]|nr:unnamed protein product [Closterium sp. Naga37s-1]
MDTPPSSKPYRLPLPALSGAAKLTIIGKCMATRCIISGEGAFPIFTSPSSNPPGGLLTLFNLNFQRAAGGVFFNVQTAINASKCGFVMNMAPSGGVLSSTPHSINTLSSTPYPPYPTRDSFPATATPPNRLFSGCTFRNNTASTGRGGAISINAENPKGSVPALLIEGCTFQGNRALNGRGGAISVSGTGSIRIKGCRFENNNAGGCVPVCEEVCPFVRRCARGVPVCEEVCPSVRRCARLCGGVPVCVEVCPSVRRCARLCGGVPVCEEVCPSVWRCARLCGGVPVCVEVCPSVWRCARLCGGVPVCVPVCEEVCPSVRRCARLCGGVPVCVEVCPSVRRCARLCGGVPVCEEVCPSVWRCARLCGGVPVCVEVCPSVWRCARLCGGVPVCVEVCPSVRRCARLCGGVPVCEEVCPSVWRCARLCGGVPVCVEVCPSVWRCARLCGGVPVCVEVCPSVWRCARLCGGVPVCVEVCPSVWRCARLCGGVPVCVEVHLGEAYTRTESPSLSLVSTSRTTVRTTHPVAPVALAALCTPSQDAPAKCLQRSVSRPQGGRKRASAQPGEGEGRLATWGRVGEEWVGSDCSGSGGSRAAGSVVSQEWVAGGEPVQTQVRGEYRWVKSVERFKGEDLGRECCDAVGTGRLGGGA